MSVATLSAHLRKLAGWLFWPALALVVWGELRPGNSDLEHVVWDKVLHFTAYFGLAGIATVALRARRPAIWAILGLIAAGGLLEIIQGMVGRDADIFDELANTLGALSGGAAGWIVVWLLGRLLPEASRNKFFR